MTVQPWHARIAEVNAERGRQERLLQAATDYVNARRALTLNAFLGERAGPLCEHAKVPLTTAELREWKLLVLECKRAWDALVAEVHAPNEEA